MNKKEKAKHYAEVNFDVAMANMQMAIGQPVDWKWELERAYSCGYNDSKEDGEMKWLMSDYNLEYFSNAIQKTIRDMINHEVDRALRNIKEDISKVVSCICASEPVREQDQINSYKMNVYFHSPELKGSDLNETEEVEG